MGKLDQEIERKEKIEEKTRKFILPLGVILNLLFLDKSKELASETWTYLFYFFSLFNIIIALLLILHMNKTSMVYGYGLKFMKDVEDISFLKYISLQQRENIILTNENASIYEHTKYGIYCFLISIVVFLLIKISKGMDTTITNIYNFLISFCSILLNDFCSFFFSS